MTKILFILDGNSFLFQECTDQPEQILKAIQTENYPLPFRSVSVNCMILNTLVVAGLRSLPQLTVTLTGQQVKVLDYLIQGLTVSQIAVAMTLSPETIKYHIENARIRMQVETRSELIAQYSQAKQLAAIRHATIDLSSQ